MKRANRLIATATPWILALALAGCASSQAAKTGEHHAGHHPTAEAAATTAAAFDAAPTVGTQARCPVSGETFTVKEDTPRATHAGRHYVFCCAKCKTAFDADPAKFATAQ